MWPFLRALPAEALARAPALISEKHLRRPCYGEMLDRPFALASFRMSASDPEACNDACRLVMVLPALILGRHSAGPEQARPGAAWIDVVEARIRRLLNGEFIELFEAIATGAPPRREADSDIDPRIGKVKRALQRARQGSVSKAVGALRGGGFSPWSKSAFVWPLQVYWSRIWETTRSLSPRLRGWLTVALPRIVTCSSLRPLCQWSLGPTGN